MWSVNHIVNNIYRPQDRQERSMFRELEKLFVFPVSDRLLQAIQFIQEQSPCFKYPLHRTAFV